VSGHLLGVDAGDDGQDGPGGVEDPEDGQALAQLAEDGLVERSEGAAARVRQPVVGEAPAVRSRLGARLLTRPAVGLRVLLVPPAAGFGVVAVGGGPHRVLVLQS
jgi:hypothetical protein